MVVATAAEEMVAVETVAATELGAMAAVRVAAMV